MSNMKFGLKNTMTELRLEVIVFKLAKEKYQVVISEIASYSNDDIFNNEIETFKRLKDAKEMQELIFTYMEKNDFKRAKKRFSDISTNLLPTD